MTILDYHRRTMCPDVWDASEQSLSARADVQIDEQVIERFPEATAVYIIGDMTGHYWEEESDLDLLIRTLPENVSEYKEEARVASGHLLTNTDHKFNFFIVSEDTPVTSIAKQFGLIYDLSTNNWIGDKNWTTNELARKSALLQYINWHLFKVKNSFDLEPYSWRVLLEAFRELPPEDREHLIKALKGRISRLEHSTTKHLKGEPKDSWKLVDRLEEDLSEGNIRELSGEYVNLPKSLLYSILHSYRYEDLVDTLEGVHEVMLRNEQHTASIKRFSIEKEDEDKKSPTVKKQTKQEVLAAWKQINSLATQVFQSKGGFDNADKTAVSLISYLFSHNQFLKVAQTRRDIVTKLYNKYYREAKEESDVDE